MEFDTGVIVAALTLSCLILLPVYPHSFFLHHFLMSMGSTLNTLTYLGIHFHAFSQDLLSNTIK